jgi:hypothetical protein
MRMTETERLLRWLRGHSMSRPKLNGRIADEVEIMCVYKKQSVWWDEATEKWWTGIMRSLPGSTYCGVYKENYIPSLKLGPFDSQLEAMIAHDLAADEVNPECYPGWYFTKWGRQQIQAGRRLTLDQMLDHDISESKDTHAGRYFWDAAEVERAMERKLLLEVLS